MKRLDIKDCNECPWCDGLECYHFEAEHALIRPIGIIPNWCPLPDAQQEDSADKYKKAARILAKRLKWYKHRCEACKILNG